MLEFRFDKVGYKDSIFDIKLFRITEKPDYPEFSNFVDRNNTKMTNYLEILPLDFSMRKYLKFICNNEQEIDQVSSIYCPERDNIYKRMLNRHVNLIFKTRNKENNVNIGMWTNYKCFNTERLKKLCVNGIPCELRGEVWCHLLGSEKMLLNNLNTYRREINEVIEEKVENQINLDLDRTFPNVIFSKGTHNPEIVMELYRVLKAFASFDTKIGYCQSLNFIAAILLVNMKEEVAFWTLVQLVSQKRNENYMICGWSNLENYYEDGMKGIICDMKILKQLCKSILPEIYEKLEFFGVDIQWFAVEWFLCLFVTTFPMIFVLRLLDFIFCYGSCSLFRISIAILDINKSRILSSHDTEECIHIIKNIREYTEDPQKILRRAIKYNIHDDYINLQRIKINCNYNDCTSKQVSSFPESSY